MVAIHAISGRTLALGREGENLARQVVFDISEWRASYGDGTVSLIAQRHGDAEPYPCNITVDGDTITWPITAADTAHPDYGKCELRYSVGDVLVKSEMWRTFVADALGTPQPEPPEPQKAWVDKVLAAGQAAVDASVNAPKIGSNGNWWVWDAEAGAYVDTGVAASGGGGGGAVSSVNGKTGDVKLTAGDVNAVPSPDTASVGQIVRVKAVDNTGKPTEWEAADESKKPFNVEEYTVSKEDFDASKDTIEILFPDKCVEFRLYLSTPISEEKGNILVKGYTLVGEMYRQVIYVNFTQQINTTAKWSRLFANCEEGDNFYHFVGPSTTNNSTALFVNSVVYAGNNPTGTTYFGNGYKKVVLTASIVMPVGTKVTILWR